MSKTLTKEEFIQRAILIHNNKFNYDNVIYINYQTKVKIICPIHDEFEQIPASHLQGIGCKKCGVEKRVNQSKMSAKDFISKSNILHDNSYNYSLVEYKNSHSKISIICKKCNNIFKQAPYSHLNKHGCPKCNFENFIGWSKTKWITFCNLKNNIPVVYIIRCYNHNEEFIKIGRTSRSVRKRFKNKQAIPYSYEIIKEIKGSPDFVWDKEVELHRLYKEYKYKPLISFGGETECFNISIIKDFI